MQCMPTPAKQQKLAFSTGNRSRDVQCILCDGLYRLVFICFVLNRLLSKVCKSNTTSTVTNYFLQEVNKKSSYFLFLSFFLNNPSLCSLVLQRFWSSGEADRDHRTHLAGGNAFHRQQLVVGLTGETLTPAMKSIQACGLALQSLKIHINYAIRS